MSEDATVSEWLKLSLVSTDDNNSEKSPRTYCRIYLGPSHPGIYFTRREAECLYHLRNTKKRSTVAKLLGLSLRTVETYIECAKRKLGLHTQKALLQALPHTHFDREIKEKLVIV